MPGLCPSVKAPEAVRAAVDTADYAELPALAGELARSLATVFARSASAVAREVSPAEEVSDALLTVDEAAARLGVQPSWLYRHHGALPFARKIGWRTLRFSSRGLERWASSR